MILTDGAAIDTVNGCQGYAAGFVRASLTAVDAADTRANNVRYTASGILRLHDATAGLPAGAVVNDGLAVSSAGQLCISTDAPAVTAQFIGGMAVAENGAVHVSDMSPAAWYRLNQGITVTGAGVSTWADKSGNARDLLQGTDARRPTLQSDGTALFDGAAQMLVTANFALNQPTTVYLLSMPVTWTDNDVIFDGTTDLSGIAQQSGVTPQVRAFAGAVLGSVSPAVGAYSVICCVFNGASSVLQLNNGTPVTGDAGASNMGGFVLGARAAAIANGNFANIRAKEAIIYAAAHSAAQRFAVISGLLRL